MSVTKEMWEEALAACDTCEAGEWCADHSHLLDYHTDEDEAADWFEAIMRGKIAAEI